IELNSFLLRMFKIKFEYYPGFQVNDNDQVEKGKVVKKCNTLHEVNFRILSGMIILSARQEKYFEGEVTTATFQTKQSFYLNSISPSLLFKMRASFSLSRGLRPRALIAPVEGLT